MLISSPISMSRYAFTAIEIPAREKRTKVFGLHSWLILCEFVSVACLIQNSFSTFAEQCRDRVDTMESRLNPTSLRYLEEKGIHVPISAGIALDT